MHPVTKKLFFLLISLFFAVKVSAQQCIGSFGDPIVYQNFGSGTGPGKPLPDTTKTLLYTKDNCPPDGFYTITNGIFGARNAFSKTWNNVYTDHTGNSDGYMMAINSAKKPGEFYRQSLKNLRRGNIYEFSFYVLNLVKKSLKDNNVIDPQIKYSILTTKGKLLSVDSTGVIPRTDGAFWYHYTLNFTVPEDAGEVVLTMSDIVPGGDGNDFIIDDLDLRVCRESKIVVPNTFTPNYDGRNDTWVIDQLPNYPQSVVKVFDKSGQQVFQSNGYGKAWDGRYEGYQVPVGVYYYIIDLHNNTPLISGWVMVLR